MSKLGDPYHIGGANTFALMWGIGGGPGGAGGSPFKIRHDWHIMGPDVDGGSPFRCVFPTV